MEFKEQVDKKAIFLLLGCYCNNPKLALDKKYETCEYDYPEKFHRIIWGAIVNIARKRNVDIIDSFEIENELSYSESALKIWKINNGWDYIVEAIEMSGDKLGNVGKYFDDVRKYSIIRNASEQYKIDVSFIYDEKDEEKSDKFQMLTSNEVLGEFTVRFLDFQDKFSSSNENGYSFHAGDDIKERIYAFKNQEESWGYPFQSGYLTTIFRGMRPKKYILRSSISGGGKSRSSITDAINISSDKIYDWSKKEWISTGSSRPVLFISTELQKEEIQDCLLAHISGIDEDRLARWESISEEEYRVLIESSYIVEQCSLYCEYMPDFTIDTINNTIEKYVINKKIEYCFFDYINDSPSLYSYYYEKSKTRLRTDQILYMFSEALKLTANKFNIFLGSSTQLNDTYKENVNKDASALKGSKSIIEKADGGVLALPVTHKDIKKLEPILNSSGAFGINVPNMAYYIFKNRGGKWKSIIVWTKLNLGTMREVDCFVTDYDFQLITDIEKTLIEFQLDDIGDVGIIDEDNDINATDVIDLVSELSKSN